KPRPASDIQQPAVQFHPTTQIETFPKMPGHASFPVTNARQVYLLVPSQEQFEINDHLADLFRTKVESERFKQLADSGLGWHLQQILEVLQGLRKGMFHMERPTTTAA